VSDDTEIIIFGCERFKEEIELAIESDIGPPNAPSTIAKKGHDLTLRDSFAYLNSIEYVINDDNSGFVGVLDPTVLEYAITNELGSAWIPSRPAVRIAFDTSWREISDEMIEKKGEQIIDLFMSLPL